MTVYTVLFTPSHGQLRLLALLRLAKHQPVAMLTSGMVRRLPSRVDDGPFANFYYAVAGREPSLACSIYQFDVRPLVTVMMDVVCDLAEQNALFPHHSIGFTSERRKRMRKRVMVFLRRAQHQAEARVEVFLDVSALIRNVWRVIHHRIETSIPKRHCSVVSHQTGPVPGLDIQPDDRPLASSPEPSAVYGRIENFPRLPARVEVEHLFEKLRVVSVPDGWQGFVTRSPFIVCLRLSESRKRLENSGHCGENPLYTLVVHSRNCESLAKQVPTVDFLILRF
jgi:hypothetical protein